MLREGAAVTAGALERGITPKTPTMDIPLWMKTGTVFATMQVPEVPVKGVARAIASELETDPAQPNNMALDL